MNSWAKLIKLGTEKGFEFFGFFNRMEVYKNGQLIAVLTNMKQLKKIIQA